MLKQLFFWLLGVTLFVGGNEDFTEKVAGVEFDMVYVKGGTFRMGATSEQGNNYDSDECPVHAVTLSDYYIGRHEVTQGLWKTVMGTTIEQQRAKSTYDGSGLVGVGDDYPMYYVSWEDAQEFCMKLSRLTGKKYVLPTEAQWEYAARGGEKSKGYKYSGSNDIGEVAWYYDNSAVDHVGMTHPVGTKQPNELGIYDMSGNVWEWCGDWYGSSYYTDSPATNPTGPVSGSDRVGCGGSWSDGARDCRVSVRGWGMSGRHSDYLGFRLVMLP